MQKQFEKELNKLLVFGLIIIAKSLFWFSKLTHLGSGTSLPGLLVEKFCPFIIAKISQDLEQIILISGTNGKTTTRALLVHIWEKQGFEVCTNRGGANILRGIAATLLLNQKITGGIKSSIAILEVEEATMPILTKYLVPNQLILTNIFRDQLDAYGEIDQTLSYFSQSIKQIQKNQNLINQPNNQQDIQNWSKKEILKTKKLVQNWQISSKIDEENNQLTSQNQSKILDKVYKEWQSWQEKIKIGKNSLQKLIGKSTENSKNNSSNQGFKGFFGRQFPSQNIYESDFKNNSTNSTINQFNINQVHTNHINQVNFDDVSDEEKIEIKQTQVNNQIDQKQIGRIGDIGSNFDSNCNLNSDEKQNSEQNKQVNQLQNQLQIEAQAVKEPFQNIDQNIQKNNTDNKYNKISSLKIGNQNSYNQADAQNHNDEQKGEQNNEEILNSKINNLSKTQVIINTDDSKLLTCLEDCTLPIIGFSVATDFVNKPTFEKNENPFIPVLQQSFVAQSIAFRNQISLFTIPIEQTELSIENNLLGFFNLYNTIAAIASSYPIFGKKIIPSIASFQPVFGRGEIINLKNNQISLYLVKNPAGFEQILDLIVTKNKENNQILLYQKNQTKSTISQKKLNLGFLINDKIADGKDLSWLWDVNFEEFEQNIEPTKIMTGGIRGADLLLRLEQAGFDVKAESYQRNINKFLDKIEESGEDWIICATYTAMMDFRSKISKKTKLKKINESGF